MGIKRYKAINMLFNLLDYSGIFVWGRKKYIEYKNGKALVKEYTRRHKWTRRKKSTRQRSYFLIFYL